MIQLEVYLVIQLQAKSVDVFMLITFSKDIDMVHFYSYTIAGNGEDMTL